MEADGNLDMASALMKRAARLNPTLPGLYDQAARVALASGDLTSAAAFAAKAREQTVENAAGDRSWDRSR